MKAPAPTGCHFLSQDLGFLCPPPLPSGEKLMVAPPVSGQGVGGWSLSPTLPVPELGHLHAPHLLWNNLVIGAQRRGRGLLSSGPRSLRMGEGP